MNKTLLSEAETAKVWRDVLERIRQELSDQSFKAWIEPLRLLSYDGLAAGIGVPDKFYGEWIQTHFQEIIKDGFLSAAGDKPQISFIVSAAVKTERPPVPEERAPVRLPAVPSNQHELNPKNTFENFVPGSGNRLAHAAALAISDAPARIYNPFFIYGSVGLGKTHLMQAIAHRILSKNPQKKICYTTSERFTNQLIHAIQTRSTLQFRNRYRSVDVLLIDDIHFIAGKESTQEEFFHTFNALYDAHKQIIVTSDRPPRDIAGLEERLVSRFGWGLVSDMQLPDFETRVAILKKKMEKETVSVSDEVAHFIAKKIKSNIRELEGALIRVVAYSSLTGTAVDIRLAQEILKDTFSEEAAKITIGLIQKKVADYFNIKVSDLSVKSRVKSVSLPRQIAMFLVRELTAHSLPEIGEYFGGRNHATVIHSCQKIKEEMQHAGFIQNTVAAILKQIKSDSY